MKLSKICSHVLKMGVSGQAQMDAQNISNQKWYSGQLEVEGGCRRSFVGQLFLKVPLLMKRRSWSIMRQPNQAAIVPISRNEATRKPKTGFVKMLLK